MKKIKKKKNVRTIRKAIANVKSGRGSSRPSKPRRLAPGRPPPGLPPAAREVRPQLVVHFVVEPVERAR